MAQMTPEVSKLLEQALSLSVEEQEALADSLISNLDGKVDEGVQAAWAEEIARRVDEIRSGKAVGSEEARCRASLRPPLKLYVPISGIQLSRRHPRAGVRTERRY